MTALGVSIFGASSVAYQLREDSGASDQKVSAILRHHSHLVATRTKANASGRPGPNAPTGDYRRSITASGVQNTGGHLTVYVGTNLPQGRRLEFGFHGMDSLGRVYNQPPYPHFGPALDAVGPDFVSALDKYLEKL